MAAVPTRATNARTVALFGAAVGVVGTLIPHGIAFNPNRVVDAPPMSLLHAFGGWGVVLLALWICAAVLAASSLAPSVRGVAVSLAAGIAPVLMLWRAGVEAARFAAESSDAARTSLLAGAALVALASYVTIFAATAWLSRGWRRGLLAYLPVLGAVGLAVTGRLSELAVAREYANNAETFAIELRIYLFYVLGATTVGLLAGVTLGLLAARRRAVEPLVFDTLNVLQVVPTLAFVGLLYPVLSALSSRFALFEALGVRGVGWAPVLIVLSAYAVYPIARNTYAGVANLDPAVTDAATGMGMGDVRRLVEVELPLALPVIVAGLRVALVQTTAGAIVAGLVGGGGLGTFVFLGVSETAADLILLGVLPIVVLGLFFDRVMLALEQVLIRRRGVAE